MGASPMLLLVTATARTSSVSSSIPMWILRQRRRLGPPCLRAFHSPSPSALMHVLSINRFKGPVLQRYGRLTFSVFWRRHSVLKSGTTQSSPTSRNRLCTKPVVCRNGIPNSTLKVTQVWIAASLKQHWRPRFPVGGGAHSNSGSNQIDSDPRCFSAVLYEDQFLVLYFVGDQLLMPLSYHAGFTQ